MSLFPAMNPGNTDPARTDRDANAGAGAIRDRAIHA
jgi:hypothetical protein